MEIKKSREIKRVSTQGDTNNTNLHDIELNFKQINQNFMNKYRINNKDCTTNDKNNKCTSNEIKGQIIEASTISSNDNAIFESDYMYIPNINENPFMEKSSINKNSNTRYTLPKRKIKKRFFEEFLVIGIENKGLEYIFDIDELMLTPKILYNYPNQLNENELKFNIKFITNFCFNEGVKVRRYEIDKNDYYEQIMFDSNFFSRPKKTFCLLQQVTPEDIQKYLVFGITFEDFIVTPIKDKNKTSTDNIVNIFIYEKTYLLISNEPLCNLFEGIFQTILNVKKLNFLNNLEDFSCIYSKNKFDVFSRENNEKTSYQIKEIIDFFFQYSISSVDINISFKSHLNNILFNYYYPKEADRKFIAMEWLSKRFLKLFSLDQYYEIFVRILSEQSFVFISNDIQNLTLTVLGFSFLILPFKWPFILIPNLPFEMMEVLESPVPNIIGIIGGDETLAHIRSNTGIFSNIIHINDKEQVDIYFKEKLQYELPSLGNLKNSLFKEYNLLTFHYQKKSFEAYEGSCINIFKTTYNNLKLELADKISSSYTLHVKDLLKKESNLKNRNSAIEEDYNNSVLEWKRDFYKLLNFGDREFGKVFRQTQMFFNYIEDRVNKSI